MSFIELATHAALETRACIQSAATLCIHTEHYAFELKPCIVPYGMAMQSIDSRAETTKKDTEMSEKRMRENRKMRFLHCTISGRSETIKTFTIENAVH